MNRWNGICRLTRDPEIRVTQDGKTTVARFGIAVDYRGKADFFNVTAFNKTAEFAEKYLHKGMKVGISGRLSTDEYTNRDGQKVTSVIIIADEVEFCERKESKEEPKNEFMALDALGQEELPFNF